jgi:uncharacterized hydrophobic protein (TIGR00271 family)
VLRLRVAVEEVGAADLASELEGTGGVHQIVSMSRQPTGDGIVLEADLLPSVADRVLGVIKDRGIADDGYLITRQEVIAPAPAHGQIAGGKEFAWIEVMGEARANARPLGRYLALMAVAAVIAALGVIKDNPILIVGAMAVSPDLLPICATCVGVVAGRWRLARRAAGTLLFGILLTWAVAAIIAWSLQAVDVLSSGFQVNEEGLNGLADVDYSTILVALAAGIAAMLAFETRAANAVGVAISVTTIPASALFGVSLGLGEVSVSWGAAGVLAANVALLLLSGSLTLAVQTWLARRRSTAAGPTPTAGG